MASAVFRQNQPGITAPKPATGQWGIAREDLELLGDGGTIEFEAQDVTALSYTWELISQPPGASAVVVDPTLQTSSVDLIVTGGYLIRLIVDEGLSTENVLVLYAGIPLANSGLPLPAFNELDFDNSQPPNDGARGWYDKLANFWKWLDETVGGGGTRRRAVIDYVDCTAAPPTEVDGDRYILDDTVGTVHASWDGASKLDIVEYSSGGGLWDAETPEEGWITYVDAIDKDMRYVDDGTPAWEVTGGLVLYENDLGASNPELTTRRTVFGNSALGDYSNAVGQLTETPAQHTWARGYRAKAYWVGQDAYSSRLDAAAAGDAQRTEAGVHGETDNGTPTDTLTLDNAATELTLQNNFVYSCQFNVVAKYDNNTVAQVAAWVGEFLVVVDDSGTVTLAGKNINKYANTTDLYEDEWLLDIAVSSTKIEINVDQGGNQGGTVLWEGYIKIAELLADATPA